MSWVSSLDPPAWGPPSRLLANGTWRYTFFLRDRHLTREISKLLFWTKITTIKNVAIKIFLLECCRTFDWTSVSISKRKIDAPQGFNRRYTQFYIKWSHLIMAAYAVANYAFEHKLIEQSSLGSATQCQFLGQVTWKYSAKENLPAFKSWTSPKGVTPFQRHVYTYQYVCVFPIFKVIIMIQEIMATILKTQCIVNKNLRL